MPAVRDLNRLRRTGIGAIGVGAGPVPTDDLHARVGTQPVGQGVGLPVGEQVDRPVAVHVDQHGAVDMATPCREIINAKNPHPGGLRVGQRTDQPQHRAAAGQQAQTGSQPRRGAAGQRQPDDLQRRPPPGAAPSMPRSQTGHLLGVAAYRAAPLLTDQQAYPQHDRHPPTTHRHIGNTTLVTAMHPRTQTTTPRARRLIRHRGRPDPHLDRADLDSFDPHLGQVRQ
jgi:hypothetical protein